MRQISHSGHVMFSVASAAQMLQRDNPNLEEINLILKEAVAQRSDSASYFDLILKVLGKEGFSKDEILPVLTDLFEQRRLAECGRALANIGGIPFFWGHYWTRPLPLGLERRFACSSKGTCKGHGRRPNIFWPLAGDDEEYSTTDLCLLCRLDVEIAWFLVHFRFLEDAKF